MSNQWENMEVLVEEAHFSVATVADWLGLSPRQLRRLFKEELGVSPGKCMHVLRVRRAREIRMSGERVKEAAQRLSYNDPSNLTRAIRQDGRSQARALLAANKQAC